MPKSRLTLELDDNEELAEIMASREPGQKMVFKVWGTLLDNTTQQSNLALDHIEHVSDDSDEIVETTDDEKPDYGETTVGPAVDKAMAKS